MDAPAFVETIETAMATELNRLGSQKLLLALTGADLERETILQVVVTDGIAARELYESWATGASTSAFVEAIRAAADREEDHLDRLEDEFDITTTPSFDRPPVYTHLQEYTTPIERTAGGLVALPMLRMRTYNQVVGFFINEAAPGPTDVFRDLKAETETAITDGAAVLAELCTDETDQERARSAAEATITAAYESYAETLEGMGLDPRPIC
ncbi:MAG: rubrerythrin family protein [Halobacteriales archaeon]